VLAAVTSAPPPADPGPTNANTPPANGSLAGIVVADFSRVLAGPLATMTLGDLGADVWKVERPGSGDETRTWTPPATAAGESTYFLAVNRNKRSLALDLSTVEGRGAARALVRRSDVVVENFAPGTMERFGLGYGELAAGQPGLIYASVTGFGRAGGATRPGYDFLIQAVGGLMSITGEPQADPTKVGVALVDVLAGQNLVAGVLAALYHRERTGLGQRVEVDLLTSLLAGLVNQASAHLNAGIVPGRTGNAHPSIAPYQTLAAADRPIAVAVGNDAQFRRLADVLDPGGTLAADPRFATNPDRVHHREALAAELERRLRPRPAAHWVRVLTEAAVPCGVVNTVPEAFAVAEAFGLDPVVRLDDGTGSAVASVACPIRLSRTPATYRRRPPRTPGG
jgi:crotonobetainyl-CoA:carnitine CoA-transferase CaiB-like acyl-CoA transferase